MPVEVGDTAPDFELPGRFDRAAMSYQMHRLSETLSEGPVVLHFFPAPFTSGCEFQMCTVRDNIDDYTREGITVWGVTGHYPSTIAAWAKEHKFGVPILADYEHDVSEQYVGTYDPATYAGIRGVTKRGVVSIGADGTVRHVWIADEAGIVPQEGDVEKAIASAR